MKYGVFSDRGALLPAPTSGPVSLMLSLGSPLVRSFVYIKFGSVINLDCGFRMFWFGLDCICSGINSLDVRIPVRLLRNEAKNDRFETPFGLSPSR